MVTMQVRRVNPPDLRRQDRQEACDRERRSSIESTPVEVDHLPEYAPFSKTWPFTSVISLA
jgi:hypothetical protein